MHVRTCTIAIVLALGWTLTGAAEEPGYLQCSGRDDRVPLVEGPSLDAQRMALSPEQVEKIRRSTFALRPIAGMGIFPACTGIAISDRLMLTAGHCKLSEKAYQKHLRPIPRPVRMVRIYHVHRGVDISVLARRSGRFEDWIPVDTDFRFGEGRPGDRYGFPAFPYLQWNPFTWRQDDLLFSPVTSSRSESRTTLFGQRPCPASDGGAQPPFCSVGFCAAFEDGNSGSPMLRYVPNGRAEAIAVVAVGTDTIEYARPKPSTVSTATPVFVIRDLLPELERKATALAR